MDSRSTLDQFYKFPDDANSSSSLDSISTNATASNLPGPGRLIGRAYDGAGKVLESRLSSLLSRSSLAKKRRDQSRKEDAALYRGPDNAVQSNTTLSTNATADNLIGPGRLLGQAYEKGGRVIEVRFNRFADRLGYGPDGIVRRINNRSRDIVYENYRRTGHHNGRLEDLLTERTDEELKKDLSRLLKYARSDVPSNQVIALNHISELSINESYIRRLLNELDVVSVVDSVRRDIHLFRGPYENILNTYHRALVSVSEGSIFSPSQQLIHMCNNNVEDVEQSNAVLGQLLSYLNSYEVSFLALRLLNALMNESTNITDWFDFLDGELDVLAIPRALSVVMAGPHQLVDWESIDKLFWNWLYTWVAYQYRELNAAVLLLAYQYAERLPRTTQCLVKLSKCPVESEDLLRGNTYNVTVYFNLWAVIEETVDSDDLTKFMPDFLKDVTAQYETPLLSEMWENLLSPARLVLRQIFLERLVPGPPARRWRDIDRVNTYERLNFFSTRLVYLLSSSDKQVSAEAKTCIKVIRKLDRYFWENMFIHHHESMKQIKLIEVKNPKIKQRTYEHHLLRHFCPNGDVCVGDSKSRCHCLYRDFASTDSRSCMGLMWWDVMWLEISPGSAFHAQGHHPVFAGTNETTGTRFYVASPVEGDYWKVRICAIAEGASELTYWHSGADEVRTTDHFRVLVLRFEPASYPKARIKEAQKGMDATGPLYWTDERLKMRWEVPPGDENPTYAYTEC